VLVTAGLEDLPPQSVLERTTLKRIGAPPRVRLACQLRPDGAVAVVPLLGTAAGRPRVAIDASQEREIVAVFVDLRDSTRLADGRLPYDALYIVDRYVAAVSDAVDANHGIVTSVAGDGICAFFGADCAPAEACLRALRAIQGLWSALDVLAAEVATEFDHPLRFGVGCHIGLAVIGELVNRHTVHFLGEVGNIAARLEQMTKELGCTVAVSRAVLARASFDVPTDLARLTQIRGVSTDVEMVAIASFDALDELLAGSLGEPRRQAMT